MGIAILGISSAQAAVITWGTATNITGNASDVSTNGTLFDAYSGSATAVTLNGVTFEGIIPGLNATSTSINFTQGLTAGSYLDLMNSVSSPGNTSGTITLSALTFGQQYELQIWAADNGGTTTSRTRTLTTGASSVTLTTEVVAGTGSGQYVIGNFTADATTQTIDAGTSASWAMFNAMQVRAIPEPSS